MNQFKKQLLCLTALVSATHLFGAGTVSKIVPRSQSFNAARQMVGWNNPEWGINRYPEDKYYSSLNLTFGYTRTFQDNNLARCLFGDDLVCGACDDLAIKISGSAIENRASTDWLGDYFGLPRDFQSTVSFKPSISNFILDFSFYAGLDAWVDGMYFRVHGPFVHTKWSLNAKETNITSGTDYLGSYFQGYFSSNLVPVANLNASFLNYANGCVPTINNDYDQAACLNASTPTCTKLNPISWQSLCCSRINNNCECDALTRNGFAELRFVLGYNFLNDPEEDYHAGLGIYAAAPTGTSIGDQNCDNNQGRYLFEPIVGNGKHWELGAQVTAHHIFWRNNDDSKSLGVYVEANATHLFSARQTRCFDLVSAGSSSRYMIAQRLDSNRLSLPRLGLQTDSLALEFANEYAPVANLTQRNVQTSIAVQGDIAVTLAYQSNGFQWDVGYNFWGRTCENICIDNCCPIDDAIWALKGDQRVYGFTTATGFPPVALAATDSRATIHTGSNMALGLDYAPASPTQALNQFADNVILAKAQPSTTVLDIPASSANAAPIGTSNPPLFIKESDFNLIGTRGTSNKVFTNFNWKWDPSADSKWTPYVGFGAEIEFGTSDNNCCTINECENSCKTSCESSCGSTCTPAEPACNTAPCTALPRRDSAPATCVDCALSQWGLWLKVGASYN